MIGMPYEKVNVEVNLVEKEPKMNQEREEIDDKDEIDILPHDFLL